MASSASARRGSRSSSTTASRRDGRTRRGAPGRRLGRPFVTYKAAITLDGRVTVPGARWVTGEESRRLVHELRAAVDAVAVGMGTVRADAPRLDARDVPVTRQPRRLAFGRGPAARRIGARAALGNARRGARRARRRRRAVAPARGRADARDRVPRGRPRRQAARLHRADPLRRRAALARAALVSEGAAPRLDAAGRRRTCSSRPTSASRRGPSR